MAVDATTFREALKDFPAGVTIVTSADELGQPVGATVSAFASLSLDPPLVVVCLKRESTTVSAIRARQAFAVHILCNDQAQLALRFASDRSPKFEGLEFAANASGVPLLDDCPVRLECELNDELPGGDHVILVGLVVDASNSDTFEPLVYANRRFLALGSAVA
jgi:flavin reductase (DIM6/NTAB) family NADH-FMN oxidoreductase RutF